MKKNILFYAGLAALPLGIVIMLTSPSLYFVGTVICFISIMMQSSRDIVKQQATQENAVNSLKWTGFIILMFLAGGFAALLLFS